MRCWPACRRSRDLRLDRADHALRDLRHQPGAGGGARGGGLADDRGSVGNIAEPGSPELLLAALTLAFLSGAFLILAMGVLRLGFLANFLSHPVIAGFITASGISSPPASCKHVLGIEAAAQPAGTSAVAVRAPGRDQLDHAGHRCGATAFLFWVRKGLMPLLLSTRA
jgi:SulP family sulfate permease